MCHSMHAPAHAHNIYRRVSGETLSEEGRERSEGKKKLYLVSLSFETSELTLQSFCFSTHSVQVRRMELICKVKQRMGRPDSQTDCDQSIAHGTLVSSNPPGFDPGFVTPKLPGHDPSLTASQLMSLLPI